MRNGPMVTATSPATSDACREPDHKSWRARRRGVVFQSEFGDSAGWGFNGTWGGVAVIVRAAPIIKGEDRILGNSKLCLLLKQTEHSFTSFSERRVSAANALVHRGLIREPDGTRGAMGRRGAAMAAGAPASRVLRGEQKRPPASPSSFSRTAFGVIDPTTLVATSFVGRPMDATFECNDRRASCAGAPQLMVLSPMRTARRRALRRR